MTVNVFIQARMSSSRYPGKVMAPLYSKPIIRHIIERVQQVQRKSKFVILTSTEMSDDPLATYVESLGCLCFRGSLENVFERFQECARRYPSKYFVRLCADSPLIEPMLIDALIEYTQESKYDLISNAFGHKFPKGQSVEIIQNDLFLNVNVELLSDYEREHVMPYFYKNKECYKTLFFDLNNSLEHINMCVDTLEDLKALQSFPYPYVFNKQELCKTV